MEVYNITIKNPAPNNNALCLGSMDRPGSCMDKLYATNI